jgi:hypothetical protein
VTQPKWFVLGFTDEDLVGAWQDARLAEECVRAWRDAGRPADFRVLQAAGEGDHMTVWFVNAASAAVLDAHDVPWRRFVIGERDAPPPGASDALADRDE